MTDDINNPQEETNKTEDEQEPMYKAPESEQEYKTPDKFSQEFGSSPMSGGTESLISFIKNQKAVAVVGGLILLYVIMSFFTSSDDEEELMVVNNTEPAVEEAAPVLESEPVSLFASIDEMAEETDKASEDMDRLKTQIASLNRQNVDLRNRMDKVDGKLDALTKAIERSSMQLSALAKTQEKDTKKETKEVLQEYRIRAVISGRAWLEDGAGNNITVKVGDNLPTYGRVTKIRPVEGIVETSSGRTITFSGNE